ncbi:MAG: hypothetical protein MUF24_14530 [Chitinophagaceae bacterium]|nr:hypothetical protein [Chitinophagaceae bacterium]
MRLQWLSCDNVDPDKWNKCLQQADNSLIYAHTDFLNAMSPGWEGLVADDYTLILPATRRSKYGITYLCQPAFAQQLGIFGKQEAILQQQDAMLQAVQEKYKFAEVYLNYLQTSLGRYTALRNNYVLTLGKAFDVISENFKTDLRKNLKRAEKFNLTYAAGHDATEAIGYYQTQYGAQLGYTATAWKAFCNICEKWINEGKAIVRKVVLPKTKGEELLSIALFLKDEKRLYNVASTTLPNGRMMEANHVLLNELIREYAQQPLQLDFEGSDLPGVAKFYQKFNPVNEPYAYWKINRLPYPLRWFKK